MTIQRKWHLSQTEDPVAKFLLQVGEDTSGPYVKPQNLPGSTTCQGESEPWGFLAEEQGLCPRAPEGGNVNTNYHETTEWLRAEGQIIEVVGIPFARS